MTIDPLILEKLDDIRDRVATVQTDIAVIKGKDYDASIKEIRGTVYSHGERLSRAEVRSGFIAIIVSFLGGLASYLMGGSHSS